MTNHMTQDAPHPDRQSILAARNSEEQEATTGDGNSGLVADTDHVGASSSTHASLKYSLLGPSLTKAGQDSVDQSKASAQHMAIHPHGLHAVLLSC